MADPWGVATGGSQPSETPDPWGLPDEAPDPWGVASPPARTRKPRKLGERFVENAADSLARSGLGQMARRLTDPDNSGGLSLGDVGGFSVDRGGLADRALSAVGINVGTDPHVSNADRAERTRRQAYEADSAADPFYDAPGGLGGKIAAGAATLGGQLVGAAVSPENWVSPGKTLATRAAGQAGVSVAADAALQAGDVQTGVQDEWSPMQTASAGLMGAGLSAAGDLAAPLARKGVDVLSRYVRGLKNSAPMPRELNLDPWSPIEAISPGVESTPARKTSPVADIVRTEAQRFGVDPDAALVIAKLESGLNPKAANGKSSAAGLYQFTDDTWNAMGGGDKFDPRLSAARGAELLRDNAQGLTKRLGRPPEGWELYLAHQQGLGGATAILDAPDQPAVDVLRAAGVPAKRARDSIVNNGGKLDMTAGEFAAIWRDKYAGVGGKPSPAKTADPLLKQASNSADQVLDPWEPVDDNPIPLARTTRGPLSEPGAQATPAEPDLMDTALDTLRRGENVTSDQGPTLMEHLARNGGLADAGGELSALDAEVWHKARPFMNRLVREDGRPIADAAVAAQEAGFLPERVGEADNRATPEQLVEAIRQELAGKPAYARESQGAAELKQIVADLEEVMGEAGIDLSRMSNAEARAAIDRYFRDTASRAQAAAPWAPTEPQGAKAGVLAMRKAESARAGEPVFEQGERINNGQTFWVRPRDGGLNDYVFGWDEPGQLRIETSSLSPEMRGQGRGLALYEHAAAKAFATGRPLVSDMVVSPDARRIYAAMRRRGFTVQELPRKQINIASDGTWSSTTNEPVFRVTAGPANSAGLPMGPSTLAAEASPPTNSAARQRLVMMMQASAPRRAVTGLRDAPRPAPIEAGKGGERAPTGQRRLPEIVEGLRRTLNIPHRQGRLNSGRNLGEYDMESGVVRTRSMHEIDVFAHEATHALEYKEYPALKIALDKYETELRRLAYPGAAPNVMREEGFAEWGRWYITNPEVAKKEAPGFYAAFEAALAKDAPNVLAGMIDAQDAYAKMLKSASVDVLTDAVITTKPSTPLRDFAKAVKLEGLAGAVRDISMRAYTNYVDGLHPLNRAVQELRKIYEKNTGKPLDLRVAQNPYALARLSRDAYGSGHMDIVHGVRPYDGTAPKGVSLSDALETALGKKADGWKPEKMDQFGAYLVARRMVHEWRRYSDGKLESPPDRFSAEFHEQAIKDFEKANPTWRAASKEVYQWNRALWQKEFDAGLISESTFEAGLTEHPDYVPLQRDVSDKASAGRRPVSGTGEHSGGAQQFRGSTRDFINPIESMMRRSYDLSALIARNDAFKALDDLAQKAGRGAGAIAERIPAKEMEAYKVDVVEALKTIAKAAGLSPRDVTTLTATAETMAEGAVAKLFKPGQINARGEPIIFVWRNGRKTPLRLPDERFGQDLFNALTGMTDEGKSVVIDLMSAPTQALRYGVTASPEFFVSNFIRDQVATWINTDVGFKPVLTSARGLADEVTQADITRLYNSFGGTVGGSNVAALSKARLHTDLTALRKRGYAIRRFASWNGLAELTELSETGTRLGVFRLAMEKARKEGMSEQDAAKEAAYIARDFMDFGRYGSKMLAARRVVTFLNAAIQGLDKAARVSSAGGQAPRIIRQMLSGRPITAADKQALIHSGKWWAKVSALGALGLTLRAIYADDAEYEEISDYLRATHWIVKSHGEWLAVPKPFELAVLSNVAERAYEGMAMKDPTAWKRLVVGLGEVLVPPHEIPAIGVPMQVISNRDHDGRPIVPEHLRGSVEPRMQFNSYTSDLAKQLGNLANVSPAVIDHVLAGFGGSLARYGVQSYDMTGRALRGEEAAALSPEDAFLSRRFIRDVTRSSTSQKEFWRLVSRDGGTLTRALGTVRKLADDGSHDTAAVEYLNSLQPGARAFTRSQLFGTSESAKLHPLMRAQAAANVISTLRTELRDGDLTTMRGTEITLTPSQRRDVDDALAHLSMAEMRTALIVSGVSGWTQKAKMPRATALARLKAVDERLPGVLSTALAVEGVPTTKQSADYWNKAKIDLEAPADPRSLRQEMTIKRLTSHTPAKAVREAYRVRYERGRALTPSGNPTPERRRNALMPGSP